jgi:hypothetical protein
LVPSQNHRANGCRLEKRPPIPPVKDAISVEPKPLAEDGEDGAFWHVLVKNPRLEDPASPPREEVSTVFFSCGSMLE